MPPSKKTKANYQPKLPVRGKVGIFWVFRGHLLAATFNVSEGEPFGDAINGRTDHVHYWPTLREQHPPLRHLEYQDVPRGRVLYMQPTGKFLVYLDRAIQTAANQRAILKEFQLPPAKTRFLSDPHYTTDPEELARLFQPD